ncbi:MAG: dienelactone hydrolase [Bdellovibrionales bacterium RIFCSPHIGHO2_01_FULL_40_29]|nr:MAG: dienelactone hydrolase [Bdellovibrionales bacterium RIFCSPHIGHO2_01_FULL_40_29]OFZ34877.1 MAG: dienelactone hydrolase [Bdellovibrionales bacterium RIFCSPHIGHO2_02_FULL_40_15]
MKRKSAKDFPQELWTQFDRYVHGEMDRRTFLRHAQKFAIGGLTVAALWKILRPNYAWAIQVPKNDKRIKTEDVIVLSPEGNGKIRGHLAMPAKAGIYPVVLVVHENRGLNPYIEDVARRLATDGFIAFAPDGLTSLGGYPGDDEKGGVLFKNVDREKMIEDFKAAAKWLKARTDSNGKLGAVGFCFGGAIANTLAVRMGDDLKAAVPFYGSQPMSEDVVKIKAALLIHDASLDERIVKGWPDFEAALKKNKVTYTHHMYEGSNHGFHNDTTPRYDKKAATLAWTRTIEFLKRTL